MHAYLKDKHAALMAKLDSDKAFDKEGKLEAELKDAIAAFKTSFA
jgi:F-type H+/Na+-transporting ATPase subunit alpha